MNATPITAANSALFFFVLCAAILSACGAKQHAEPPQTRLSVEEAEHALLDADIYVCDEGTEIRAAYPEPDLAIVQYRADIHVLTEAISASGARYIDDRIEWWTKGEDHATLFRHTDDGTGETLASNCRPR